MTAPAASPWARPARDRSRLLRRAADRLSALMLLATAGVAAAAWVEPALRLFEDRQLPAARRGIAEALRRRGYAVGPPEPTGHPRIRGGALDPAGAAPPRLAREERDALLQLLAPDDPADRDRAAEGAWLVVRQPLPLRQQAGDDAPVLDVVAPGARVRLVRDLGDWLLIAAPAGGRGAFGWARREQLL